MYKQSVIFFIISFCFLLVGCQASIEQEEDKAKSLVRKEMKEKPKSPNNQSEQLAFYLPFKMEIEEETTNNLIFKKRSRTYVLFYNPYEQEDSTVLYDAAKKQARLSHTYLENDKFGYLLIHEVAGKGTFQVTVGIGGIKMTTETDTRHVAKDAQMMMEIVSSTVPIK